jgi:two-component system, response regulator YesN
MLLILVRRGGIFVYKMIIVDDEAMTRDGIRNIINWEALDIQIVGEAADGIEGIALVNRQIPDIIICDIKMPHMDGVTFTSHIRSLYPNIQIIFLSGYSNEEYLRSAIKFGAVDYLDKPFNTVELLNVIEKAKQKIKGHTVMNKPEDYLGLKLLMLNDRSTLPIDLNTLPVNFDQNFFTVILRFSTNYIFSNDPQGENSNFEDPNIFMQQNFNKYYSHIKEYLTPKFIFYNMNSSYIVHFNARELYDYNGLEQNLLHVLNSSAELKPFIAIGVSNMENGVTKIKASYQQAYLATKESFYLGYGHVYYHRLLNRVNPFVKSADFINDFKKSIDNQHFSEASNLLNRLIDQLKVCRIEDIPSIKNELIAVALVLNDKLSAKDINNQLEIINLIKRFDNISDISDYLTKTMEKLLQKVDNFQNKGRIIFEVEQYIMNHYKDDLSIETIAKNVFLTPTYLCFLYKKSTGKTINSYITEVKMQKAMDLLKSTTLRLSDIAELIGYNNQNYFTRIFTKYIGISPMQYRNTYM